MIRYARVAEVRFSRNANLEEEYTVNGRTPWVFRDANQYQGIVIDEGRTCRVEYLSGLCLDEERPLPSPELDVSPFRKCPTVESGKLRIRTAESPMGPNTPTAIWEGKHAQFGRCEGKKRIALAQRKKMPYVIIAVRDTVNGNCISLVHPDAVERILFPYDDPCIFDIGENERYDWDDQYRKYLQLERDLCSYYKTKGQRGKAWNRILQVAYLLDSERVQSSISEFHPDLSAIPHMWRECKEGQDPTEFRVRSGNGIVRAAAKAGEPYVLAWFTEKLAL